MSFNFNEPTTTRTTSTNRRTNDAYLNLSLPTDRGNSKLGSGVGLSMSNARTKKIIEWLKPEETREERLNILKQNLVLTFNMADGSDQGDFLLTQGAESGLPI